MSGVDITHAIVELPDEVDIEHVEAEPGDIHTWVYLGGLGGYARVGLYATPDAWPAIHRRLGEALAAAGVDLSEPSGVNRDAVADAVREVAPELLSATTADITDAVMALIGGES